MKNDQNPIKLNLENKFKELLPKANAPEEVRKEVFQTLDTLNLLGDIADLFTGKFTQTNASFLDFIEDSDTKNENK